MTHAAFDRAPTAGHSGRARVLALVNGPWQAVALAASLAELTSFGSGRDVLAVLVDVRRGSPLHAITSKLLALYGIEHTVCIGDEPWYRSLPRAHEQVAAALGRRVEQVAAIATYGVHRPVARSFCNLAEHAQLLIYEDGLRAYVPPDVCPRARFVAAARAATGALPGFLRHVWRDPRSRARGVAYSLLLGKRVPLPKPLRHAAVHHVGRETLRQLISRAAPACRGPGLARPFVLIVGQYYARLKQMRLADEVRLYRQAAIEIARRGLVPVWRGHPRDHDGMAALLQRACPSLRSFSELVDEPSYPLEFYRALLEHNCAGAVSFSSSSLYYLNELYGLPTYTLLEDALVAGMRYPHREGCALALSTLPRFTMGQPHDVHAALVSGGSSRAEGAARRRFSS